MKPTNDQLDPYRATTQLGTELAVERNTPVSQVQYWHEKGMDTPISGAVLSRAVGAKEYAGLRGHQAAKLVNKASAEVVPAIGVKSASSTLQYADAAKFYDKYGRMAKDMKSKGK